jgi:hypothetical protein
MVPLYALPAARPIVPMCYLPAFGFGMLSGLLRNACSQAEKKCPDARPATFRGMSKTQQMGVFQRPVESKPSGCLDTSEPYVIVSLHPEMKGVRRYYDGKAL